MEFVSEKRRIANDVKMFSRYGLIGFTPHALQRCEERKIDRRELCKTLAHPKTTIVGQSEVGGFRGNEDELYLFKGPYFVKRQKPKKKKDLCVAVAKCDNSKKGGQKYKVVTCYFDDEGEDYGKMESLH